MSGSLQPGWGTAQINAFNAFNAKGVHNIKATAPTGLPHSTWGNTQINTGNADAIGRRAPSVTRWDQRGNPRSDQFGISIRVPGAKDPAAIAWLNSSDKWNRSFPEGWEAVGVLGAGGYGIAGHWRYTTPGPHQTGTVESEVRDIVVKQAAALSSEGLIKEAKMMEMLTMTGSKHFPKIYGRVHRDVGQQDRIMIDEKRREVHRIFMEFCEGGSLSDFIDISKGPYDKPDESTLWSFFHCFAKANMVLERGHERESEEYSTREPWTDGKLLVHFDLKPDNALVAGRDDDGEHTKEERVVIADFGLSQFLPNKETALEKDRLAIVDEHEWAGTENYKAPEQHQKIPRNRQRYGACTNIYQVGLLVWCLIMQESYRIPYGDDPVFTTLTGPGKRHHTMGADHLETQDEYSATLRGLVAECLFLEPDFRPTAAELLRRTREGLKSVNKEAATGSVANENLTTPSALLLDRWWGQQPGVAWPLRIPEMQRVVDLHEQQLKQVKSTKVYTPTKLRGPPPAKDDQPGAAPAAGTTNDQSGATPATGTSGTGQGPKPDSKTDVIPSVKSWPGGKFTKPIDLLTEVPPDKAESPPVSGESAKPVWNNAFEDLRRLLGGHVPRPQKRPSQEPAAGPDSKRSRIKPAPLRTIDKVNNWFSNFHLNSTGPPAKPEGRNFLVPVRIWPGPSASPVDESAAMLRTFRVPANATLNTMIALLTVDHSTGVGVSWGVWFCRSGTTAKLSNFTTISELGYEPAPNLRGPYLECFRVMTPPSGSFSKLFDVEIFIKPAGSPAGSPTPKATSVKVRAMEDTTIFKLKEVIINHGYRPDFKDPSQLRIHLGGMGGADLDAVDCPNRRTVKSFFSNGVDAKVWCSLRPTRQGGGGRGRPVSSRRHFTPPVRTHRRFV